MSYAEYGDYLVLDDAGIAHRVNYVKQKMARTFAWLRSRVGRPVVLDFGSGAGYFCKAAQEAGLEAHGVEVSEKLVSFSKERVGFSNVVRDLAEVNSRYDAIFMFDVIEHIPPDISPRLMRRLASLLNSRGHLIGNTPNANSLNLKLFCERDPVVAPPSHMCYFTPSTLDAYFSSLGLEKRYLQTKDVSSNAFFRPSKFERSFLEVGLRTLPSWKLPASVALRMAFGVAGVAVRPFGLGYQLHFRYQKSS